MLRYLAFEIGSHVYLQDDAKLNAFLDKYKLLQQKIR